MCDLSNEQLLATLLSAINNSSEELKKHIAEENLVIIKKIEEQTRRIEIVEKKCSDIEAKQLEFERLFRKNNILIFGANYNEENGDLLKFVLKFFSEKLNVSVKESDINNVFLLTKTKTKSNAPIKVEFTTFLKKTLILKNCSKLKNTKIFIAQDLCYQDQQERKVIVEHLKLARAKNYSAKIVNRNKLQVNGEIYTVSQLQQMEIENNDPLEKRSSNSLPATPSVDKEVNTFFSPSSQQGNNEPLNYNTSETTIEEGKKKNQDNKVDDTKKRDREKDDNKTPPTPSSLTKKPKFANPAIVTRSTKKK